MAEYVCPNCEYVYDEDKGDPREGWPAGTPFADVDPDWTCPDCGVREQVDFVPAEEFTHNDQDGDINSAENRAAAQQAQARATRQTEQEAPGQGSRALGGGVEQ